MIQTIENPLFNVASELFPNQSVNNNNNNVDNVTLDDNHSMTIESKQSGKDGKAKCRGLPLVGMMALIIVGGLAFVLAFAICVPLWNKRLMEEDESIKSLQKQLNQTRETVVHLNATVLSLKEDVGEKEERLFELGEKLVDANELVDAAEKQLLRDQTTIGALDYEISQLKEKIVLSNATISSLQTEKARLEREVAVITDSEKQLMESNDRLQRLNEKLYEQNDNLTSTANAIQRKNDILRGKNVNLTRANEALEEKNNEQRVTMDQLKFDNDNLHFKEVELTIEIHKLKHPHLELFCSPEVELCYFGNFKNNSTPKQAEKYCQFPQEGQLLAEPRSAVAVEYLLELTEQLNLSNVLIGATRGGDTSYRWLSDDSMIENSHWGHDAPFPPNEGADKVVMTNFEGEWAWFSAYNDQTNFNFFCQQTIYG